MVELITQITERAENREATTRLGLIGILNKINQDITWDVSGLIGIIVTIVLMMIIVTDKYNNIPKEVFAGWTTILGFYFGKAAARK